MACKKYVLTNTGDTSYFYFNYKRCADGLWGYETSLAPGQTKNIYLEDGSYSTAFPNNGTAVLTNEGTFPPVHIPTTTTTTVVPLTTERFLMWGPVSGSTTIKYQVMNYENNTLTESLETGIPSGNTWYNVDPVDNEGWLVFTYNDDLNNNYVHFIDKLGNILDSYSGSSFDNDYGTLDGKFVYMIDYNNGVMKYSDTKVGGSVVTINFDSNNDFYQQNGWDNTINNGFFIVSGETNSPSAYTLNLVTLTGSTEIMTWNTSDTSDIDILNSRNSNVIPLVRRQNNGNYEKFEVRSTAGSLLQEFVLSADTYNNYDSAVYGTNKSFMTFYSSGDNTIQYQLINYDAETDTLVTATHARGDNYGSFNFYYSNVGGLNDVNSEIIYTQFFNYGGQWCGDTRTVDYCDFVAMYSGDNAFTTHVFNNSGSYNKAIQLYGGEGFSDIGMSIPCITNTTGGYYALYNMRKSGTSYTNIMLYSSIDNNNIWEYVMGEYAGYAVFTTYATTGTFYVYNKFGVLVASQAFNGTDFNVWQNGSSLYFTDFVNGWVFNESTLTFTNIGLYNDSWTPNYYRNSGNLRPSILFIFNDNTFEGVMITPSGISSVTTFNSSSNYWGFEAGSGSLMYYYRTNGDTTLTMEYYDENLVLIHSYTSNMINMYNRNSAENAVWALLSDGSDEIHQPYFISGKGFTISNSNYIDWDYSFNDYYWWD